MGTGSEKTVLEQTRKKMTAWALIALGAGILAGYAWFNSCSKTQTANETKTPRQEQKQTPAPSKLKENLKKGSEKQASSVKEETEQDKTIKSVEKCKKDYAAAIKRLKADYIRQVGTDPKNYGRNVQAYLDYRKDPSSMTQEQAASLEKKLGRTGMSMVFLVEACEYFNARTYLNANGSFTEALEAEKHAFQLVRDAKKLDIKMGSIADSYSGLVKDENGYFQSTPQNIHKLYGIATQGIPSEGIRPIYEQWGAYYNQAAQETHVKFSEALKKQMKNLSKEDAQQISSQVEKWPTEVDSTLIYRTNNSVYAK